MSKVDYKTYTSLFEAMVMTPYFPHPDVLIYLEGDLNNILARIEERGREMELQTNRSYWEEMYTRYENWISGFNACPVLKIRIEDYDLLNDEDSIEKIIDQVSTVIHETRKK